ncbi:hypothetical protein AVEN_49130-2 [Araneus ventricosus]|uniref:Uncharacterized protein n=1 Tax=Araneus ventricosus TaxID=182803 RepID=A0A4Y2C1H6_ARAVE|nr:hypothetical protein AVEN_49130-2 [Araneus ventricosus]
MTSDSTTALCWIQRDQNWGNFVQNRVREIGSLTSPTVWRHLPGALNAADLVSRGCSGEQLLQGKWWEGPSWLSDNEENWSKSEDDPDEGLVSSEKRKTIVTTTLTKSDENVDWRFIARRGRLTTVHSGNGTNFKGAERLLYALDSDGILSKASEEKIQWKFNPLSASWWGGWWEHLEQMTKEILRKILGRAALDYEELVTLLCDC